MKDLFAIIAAMVFVGNVAFIMSACRDKDPCAKITDRQKQMACVYFRECSKPGNNCPMRPEDFPINRE